MTDDNVLKYAVIGAGGVGAMMSVAMANAGKNITAVARGAHLGATQRNGGLNVEYPSGDHQLSPVKAVSAEEITERADVIFVAKAYAIDSAIPVIRRLATLSSIVIPIQNSLFTGDVLRRCIYVVAYISAPGEVTQNNAGIQVQFGPEKGCAPPTKNFLPEQISKDLTASGIENSYSEHMPGVLFGKIAFTSAFSAAAIHFDVDARGMKVNPDCLNYTGVFHKELQNVADKAQFGVPLDIVANNEHKLNNFVADSYTSSLQKNIKKGVHREDERQEMLFVFVKLASSLHVDVPLYEEATRPLDLPAQEQVGLSTKR